MAKALSLCHKSMNYLNESEYFGTYGKRDENDIAEIKEDFSLLVSSSDDQLDNKCLEEYFTQNLNTFSAQFEPEYNNVKLPPMVPGTKHFADTSNLDISGKISSSRSSENMVSNICQYSQRTNETSSSEYDFENFGHILNFSEFFPATDLQFFDEKNEYEISSNQIVLPQDENLTLTDLITETVSNTKSKNEEIPHSMTTDSFQCNWINCGKKLLSQQSLVHHIEKYHIDSRKSEEFICMWQPCPRDSKPFNARYKLLIHMRVHSGEKPNKCPFPTCSKAFSRLENLKIHQRSHTGERPYECQFAHCTKAFSNSSDRAKHQRTHFDQKPYACQITGCLKRYTDPSSLRKHIKNHCSPQKHRTVRKQGNTNSSADIKKRVNQNLIQKKLYENGILFHQMHGKIDDFHESNNPAKLNVAKIENLSNSFSDELLLLAGEYVPYDSIFSTDSKDADSFLDNFFTESICTAQNSLPHNDLSNYFELEDSFFPNIYDPERKHISDIDLLLI